MIYGIFQVSSYICSNEKIRYSLKKLYRIFL